MDSSKNVILWVAGFAGVLLIYSAFKSQSPLSTLTAGIASNTGDTTGTVADTADTVDTVTAAQPTYTASGGSVYDENGNTVGTVPPAYGSGSTYIPVVPTSGY